MNESLHLKRVCVFCGSNSGSKEEYVRAADSLGRELAKRGIEAVYGGGRRGLMGALADATLKAGGQVQGVLPQSLVDMEIAHRGLTKLHIVDSMHARKALMNALSDAFVILPGGWGTLDEMGEVLTWAQLGIHQKPVALWNVAGYYNAFLDFARNAVQEGFLKSVDFERLLVTESLEALFSSLQGFRSSPELVPAKLMSAKLRD